MSQRDTDLRMLNELLDKHVDQLSERETEAFANMRYDLRAYWSSTSRRGFEFLTENRRSWVAAVYERITGGGYENLVSQGLVPRGQEVPNMVGTLPKRPPPIPKEPERAARKETAEHRPFRATGLDEKDDE
jgi:hypothetical protein